MLWLWIITWVATVYVAVFVFDALLRAIMFKSVTELKPLRTTTASNQRRLLIYLPGLAAHGEYSFLEMIELCRQAGDLLLTIYDGELFDPDEIASEINRWLEEHEGKYDEVVYLGSSLGGSLARRCWVQSRSHVTTKFVLLASPRGMRDLKGPGKAAVFMKLFALAGPLCNRTIGPLIMKAVIGHPKEENIEKDVNRDKLNKRVEEGRDTLFSLFVGQSMYSISRDELPKDSMVGLQGVFVQFERDELVKESAYDGWRKAFGTLPLVKVDATHVGYNEMPNACGNGMREAFEKLDISIG